MKKILLGTTALIGTALFASAASAGQTPTVTVGGFADFQTGYTSQDRDANRRSWLFQNDTEVHFRVDGKSDRGLGYGAVIELEADVNADADGEGVNADKTFLYLQGGWGRVEMGANTDAAQALAVDPANFARATGGIDGDWYDFANLTWSGSTPFILSPDLPTAHGAAGAAGINGAAGSTEDASKITYYTPRLRSGFQLGVSYTPDAGNTGTAAGFTLDNNGGFENIIGAGVNYTGKFNNVGVAASLTGEVGSAELSTQEDLAAYQIGANLSYMGWSFGGSWSDWQDSTFAKTATNKDANYWTLGAGYETGPFGASLEYIKSEYAGNEYGNVSLGADYKLAPGLVPYVEVNFFDLDRAATTVDNKGTVVLLGTQLSF